MPTIMNSVNYFDKLNNMFQNNLDKAIPDAPVKLNPLANKLGVVNLEKQALEDLLKSSQETIAQQQFPEDIEKMQERVSQIQEMPQFQQESSNLQKLQDMIARRRALEAERGPQLDLTPLMRLAQKESGLDLTSTYQRPETAQEYANRALTEEAQMQKMRSDLADKIRQMAKESRLGGLSLIMKTGGTTTTRQTTGESQELPRVGKVGKPENYEADVQKLQKNIGDQIPGIVSNLKELDKYMGRKDMPGIGVGLGMVPDILLSNEGSRVRQLATDLFRQYVYLSSGKAVNREEARDMMKIQGFTDFSKESSFRSGMKGLSNKIKEIVAQKEAAYRPEVINIWKSRQGLTSKDIPVLGERSTQTGKSDAMKRLEQVRKEREELQKKLGK